MTITARIAQINPTFNFEIGSHELGRIGMAILNDSSSYPDVPPINRRPLGKKGEKDKAGAPLDPEALLVSLGERSRGSVVRPDGPAGDYGINGVFRALFEYLDDQEQETEVLDKIGEPTRSPSGQSRVTSSDRTDVDVDVGTSRTLQKHMARFLSEYEAQEFAATCTVAQLAQATAYPICVAVMGERRGWCTDEQRRRWVSRTARVLLKDDRFHQREALITSVCRRYEHDGRREVFDQAIGDGQLWLALLVGWDRLPSTTTEEQLQQVTLFRDFVSRRELLRSAEESRIVGLFHSYSKPEVIEAARLRAVGLGRILGVLECSLRQAYRELIQAQSSERRKYEAGELVWSPTNGWGFTTENQRGQNVAVYVAKGDDVRSFRAHGWFVNVSHLGEGAPDELVVKVTRFREVLEAVGRDGS